MAEPSNGEWFVHAGLVVNQHFANELRLIEQKHSVNEVPPAALIREGLLGVGVPLPIQGIEREPLTQYRQFEISLCRCLLGPLYPTTSDETAHLLNVLLSDRNSDDLYVVSKCVGSLALS